MLTRIQHVIMLPRCSPSRLHAIVRSASLQQKHKEHSIKGKDFFIDPNLVQAFEKFKKGEFPEIPVDTDSLKRFKSSSSTPDTFDSVGRAAPKINIYNDDTLPKRENLRQVVLGRLVYLGKLDRPFKAAKSLSLTSSIGGAICYPLMLPKILDEGSLAAAIIYTIISATFVLLTPTLMQLISKRYLTSIYYQESTEQFTGFYKNFFMIERQIRFRAEDVEVPPITGMFTSMLIKKKPYFVHDDDFKDKKILMKMLGYDKEFDFSKYTKDIQDRAGMDNDDDDDNNNNRTDEQSRSPNKI